MSILYVGESIFDFFRHGTGYLMVLGALAVIIPGPDFVLVTRNSLVYSKKVGLYTAFGIVLGNFVWVAASILGVSFLIAKIGGFYTMVKVFALVYLCYLGTKMLLAKKMPSPENADGSNELRRGFTAWLAFWKGFWANLGNPKCMAFYISFFTVMLTPSTSVFTRAAFGIGIPAFALIWFSLIATILSIDGVKCWFNRFGLLIEKVAGIMLIGLGLRLAFSRAD